MHDTPTPLQKLLLYGCQLSQRRLFHEINMPSESIRWCSIFTVLATLICCSSALVILEPPELAGTVIETPRIKTIGPMDWNYVVVAELVGPDASNLTGKIILIDIPAGLSQEDMARRFNLTGSLGVITAFRNEGSYLWDGSNSSLVYTPSAELNLVDYRFLEPFIVNGTRLFVNFTSYEENPWDPVMSTGAIAFTCILMPLTAGSLGFSIYKYYTWLRYKGFQLSFVQVVLLANIIGNIVRMFSVSVDPIFSRRILPNVVNNLFLTGSWPFTLTATLLISFYWQELITKNRVQVSLFVSKLKIPFWIIVALIFSMEFTSSMLRGLYYPLGALTTLTGVVYIVCSIAISLLYFVSGGRIVQALKSSAGSRVGKVPKKLTKTTERVVASGSLMVIFAIIVAVIGLSDILYIPWGFWSAWMCTTIVLNINSVLQVAAFNVPTKKHTGSSTDLSRVSNTNQSAGSAHVLSAEGSITDN